MKKLIFSLIVTIFIGFKANAQCDTIANFCHKNNFSIKYISDGQNYRVFLFGDQEAEFNTTFFGGTTYRIAACTGFSQGNLIFKIKDPAGNILFDSMEFANAPYWDFKVSNTMTCSIIAQLDLHETQSGCASILIGFKK
jgi:hypothetical protein